jgi:hypothetical protein
VFLAECAAALLLIGFLMKDPASWVIAVLVWVGAGFFFVGIARNPVRAGKAAPRVLLVCFGVAVVAYLVLIVVSLSIN